jgi:hypothetical protein
VARLSCRCHVSMTHLNAWILRRAVSPNVIAQMLWRVSIQKISSWGANGDIPDYLPLWCACTVAGIMSLAGFETCLSRVEKGLKQGQHNNQFSHFISISMSEQRIVLDVTLSWRLLSQLPWRGHPTPASTGTVPGTGHFLVRAPFQPMETCSVSPTPKTRRPHLPTSACEHNLWSRPNQGKGKVPLTLDLLKLALTHTDTARKLAGEAGARLVHTQPRGGWRKAGCSQHNPSPVSSIVTESRSDSVWHSISLRSICASHLIFLKGSQHRRRSTVHRHCGSGLQKSLRAIVFFGFSLSAVKHRPAPRLLTGQALPRFLTPPPADTAPNWKWSDPRTAHHSVFSCHSRGLTAL